MANALGQMSNAPLIYVLAQIRFSHIPRMDKRWEDFHEKIFETYPKAESERIEEITFKDGQPAVGNSIQRWHMVNEYGTSGIILDAGMLVFHTTDYKTSDIFLSDVRSLLDAFIEILPKGVTVSRLGLRYVDLLLQEEELIIDRQVMETLRLPNLPEIGEAQRMEQVITYQTQNNGTLVIRHRQSKMPDVLPSDLFPIKLKLAPRLERKRPENSIVGLLDYDHFIEHDQAFNIDSIIADFHQLHGTSSAVFKATTTKEAFTKWQKEEH